MNFEDLTAQQKEKAIACKTPKELIELAKEEGIELTDEQLEGVSGGWGPFSDCDDYNGYDNIC